MRLMLRATGLAMLFSLLSPALAKAGEAEVQLDAGATAWMLTSTALVLLMTPGLAMFYGGLVRTKNVLGTMMHSFGAMAVVGVIWVVIGYPLAFGTNVLHGWIGWDAGNLFLAHAEDASYTINGGKGAIPELVFAMFQGKFAIITPALIAGAFAERVRFRGYCVFIALWLILVYCPVCHWVWAKDGFMAAMGAQDYAGGIVVHITAGVSALVAAIYLGARKGYPDTAMHPNNLVMTLMGAGLLWVGWFGFNGGSSVNSNFDSARALTVTQVAAATAALVWTIIEAIHRKKATSLGLVSGILAGLVAITPAAGVVGVKGAMVLGTISAFCCYIAVVAKTKFGYDDSLDVFGIHGVGSIMGVLLLPFMIRSHALPGLEAIFAANHEQYSPLNLFIVQVKCGGLTAIYSIVISIILLVLIEKTIGFRLDPTRESAGMDHSLHGEHGYGLINLQ